jgi:uncharacterized protein with HEPN domain
MKHEGWGCIDHILHTCAELEVCLEGVTSAEDLEKSVVVRRAVVMCLLDLGELFKSIGKENIAIFPSESWQNIIGFRDRAAHGYHTMDFGIVYALAAVRVPPLYSFLKEHKNKIFM